MLVQYEKIADLTQSMVQAAHQDDWDQVVELSRQYSKAVETLQYGDASDSVMTEQERAAKRDLLMRILENDAVTRELAAPQLAWLGSRLGQLKRQQSLQHAYRTPEAHLS